MFTSPHRPGNPAERRRAAAPDHRSPGRRHLRRAGLGRRRPGRLRRDHPGPRRRPVRARPGRAGRHGPGDRGRRHARLADHPDRGRRRPGRGRRRSGPGPRPAQPPVPLHRMTPASPDRTPAGPGPRPRSRPGRDRAGRCPARLTHMLSRRQNTQICSPQKTNAKGRSAAPNGGYAKSRIHAMAGSPGRKPCESTRVTREPRRRRSPGCARCGSVHRSPQTGHDA